MILIGFGAIAVTVLVYCMLKALCCNDATSTTKIIKAPAFSDHHTNNSSMSDYQSNERPKGLKSAADTKNKEAIDIYDVDAPSSKPYRDD